MSRAGSVPDVTEFLGAVTAFQAAVRAHDEDAQERELDRIRDEFGAATDEERYDAATLLADVLGSVPFGRDAVVGLVIGACVERGADAASCAEPVLFRAQLALEAAADFCRRRPPGGADDADPDRDATQDPEATQAHEAGGASQSGEDAQDPAAAPHHEPDGTSGHREPDGTSRHREPGGTSQYPEPAGDAPPAELYEELGATDPAARRALLGWWTVPMWTPAVAAVLSRKEIRKALLPKPEFLALVREVEAASGAGRFLAQALAVLDDAPLLVLHRPTGQGFEFHLSGIADNVQLHTLLAERLVTPGHLEGIAPTPEAVAACLGEDPAAPMQYEATASFNLVAPDGTWLPNEGVPADIPVLGEARVLVLDPPRSERTWPAARAFAQMRAELVLDRRLGEDGVNRLLAQIAPAENPFPDPEPEEPQRKHWWQRG
jgi:hypothetical protein